MIYFISQRCLNARARLETKFTITITLTFEHFFIQVDDTITFEALLQTSANAAGTRIQHIYETTINYPNNRSQSLGDLSSVDKILMKYFDWAHTDETRLSVKR